jgi:hypothetical protein
MKRVNSSLLIRATFEMPKLVKLLFIARSTNSIAAWSSAASFLVTGSRLGVSVGLKNRRSTDRSRP